MYAVRNMIGERKLELFTVNGASVGTFVVNSMANAWGLTSLISPRGVEVGGALIMALDIELGVAVC